MNNIDIFEIKFEGKHKLPFDKPINEEECMSIKRRITKEINILNNSSNDEEKKRKIYLEGFLTKDNQLDKTKYERAQKNKIEKKVLEVDSIISTIMRKNISEQFILDFSKVSRLNPTRIKKIFTEKGYIIFPKIELPASRYTTTYEEQIEELNNALTDGTKIKNIYEVLQLVDEHFVSKNPMNYQKEKVTNITNIINTYTSKYPGHQPPAIKTKVSLLGTARDYFFTDDNEKKKYDNYLIFNQENVIKLKKEISGLQRQSLKNPQTAYKYISKIKQIFGKEFYIYALDIYNDFAEFSKHFEYPCSVGFSLKCSNCSKYNHFDTEDELNSNDQCFNCRSDIKKKCKITGCKNKASISEDLCDSCKQDEIFYKQAINLCDSAMNSLNSSLSDSQTYINDAQIILVNIKNTTKRNELQQKINIILEKIREKELELEKNKAKKLITDASRLTIQKKYTEATGKLNYAQEICEKKLNSDKTILSMIISVRKEIINAYILDICTETRQAITNSDFPLVDQKIKEIEALDNKHPQIAILINEYTKKKEQAETGVKEIENLLNDKKIITAKSKYDIYIKNHCKYPIDTLKTNLDIKYNEYSQILNKANTFQGQGKKVEENNTLLKIIKICADFPDFKTRFHTPEKVSNIRAEEINQITRKNIIKWDIPKDYDKADGVKYKVLRKTQNGESKEIATTDKNTIEDTNITPAIEYKYFVTTEWGGKSSEEAKSEVITNCFCLKEGDKSRIHNNTNIQVSFTNIPTTAEVEVRRFNSSSENDRTKGKYISCSKNIMTDTDVQDDTAYHYRAYLKYSTSKGEKYSSDLYFKEYFVVKPPVIEEMTIAFLTANWYSIEWKEISGVKTEFYCVEESVSIKKDEDIPYHTLQNHPYKKIDIINSNYNKKGFSLPKDCQDEKKVYCVFPVSVKEKTKIAYVGKVIKMKQIIKDTQIRINPDNKITVFIDRPDENIDAVKLLYRHDKKVESENDPKAEKVYEKTMIEMNRNGITLIDDIQKNVKAYNKFFITVYAKLKGSNVFTEYLPGNHEYQICREKRIKYKLEIERGKFKGINKVYMKIMPEYDGIMPDLVLIANATQPEDINDGVAFPGNEVASCAVTSKTELLIQIPFQNLKDKYIGVFLRDEKDGLELKIVPYGGDKQRIK